ncbi:unnamed protein product [Adineta ricciae]|uniref:Uncharacterized protein n=1 Tax=Adineta ricciae TaxID=249248 RepID=A0A813RHQ0_ADIRI|nr:unnamed protein product [Adineta ricciae]
MTRVEEKNYLQSVFNAIDEVYNLKNHQQTLTYEERLRASFNKLLVPNWYNHDYTSINELRKTKSYGQVLHHKRYDYNNNHSHTDTSTSSAISDKTHRYRSQSQTWSERRPLRHHSTASSYDTNGNVVINGRRSTSTYAPGLQRVVQSSTWYKPKSFNIEMPIVPPKPRPRYSKIVNTYLIGTLLCKIAKFANQERLHAVDSSLLLNSKLASFAPISNEILRHPIKPRAMTQIPISSENLDDEIYIEGSTDGDITIVQQLSPSRTNDVVPMKHISVSPTTNITISNDRMNHPMTTIIPRTNSNKSIPSDIESYRSTMLLPLNKNLLLTDSSSYSSINEPSTASSYHTAKENDTSNSGYKTPTPQADDETISSHSSISDLSHAETLEPLTEALTIETYTNLDIVPVSTGEQKSAIILPVNVGMEKLPLPSFSSTISHASSSTVSDNSPSTESRLIESTNWYDDGSIETCIHQSSSQVPPTDSRVTSNEEILHEIEMNGAGDENFLFSPRNTPDDEPSSSFSDDKHEQDFEQLESPAHDYTMEKKNFNLIDDFVLNDEIQSPPSLDPFGYNHNNNNSSLMITNLDDILIDDDEDGDNNDQNRLDDSPNYLSNGNFRRPIQEDILYEVEHENSLSDHSQNTSSAIATDDKATRKKSPNLDLLMSSKEPIDSHVQSSTLAETSSPKEKQSKPIEINSSSNTNIDENTTLPIYISPPINTTTTPTTTAADKTSSLRIDTSSNPFASQWDSYNRRYPDLISPTSYTPKIRHRNFSVGSYYDNKTTTVAVHQNHTFFILGSAPVSPLSRTSAPSNESLYYVQHHSPIGFENVPYNALRRINPFLETTDYISRSDYRRSPSLTRDDPYRTTTITSHSQQQTATTPSNESIRMSSSRSKSSPPVTFSQEEESRDRPKSPPFESVPPLVRPKTSRGRPRSPPPPPPPLPRTESLEKGPTQGFSQEVDTTSTEDDQTTAPHADLQFIRGTIERVFDFHGESTSELSTNEDEISVDDKGDQDSVSLSLSSKTQSKKADPYPAVETIQRFYENKSPSDSDKNVPNNATSNRSSTSNNLYARSHPVNRLKKDLSDSKSSDLEQATSEEVDDTLNDIEEDEYQDEKAKRQATANNSSRSSNENSPAHSATKQIKSKKTSQETQTLQRQRPILLTTQSPSDSPGTIQSYETAHSNIPPLDIVTEMVIERNDSIDDGRIGEITGDMIIFYDDIEIVEHSSNISSSESESFSSYSRSTQNSRVIETTVEPPPPPVPARTLKPTHLINQQQSPSSQPINGTFRSTGAKVNRIYELEKSTIRKKFDVNSVNHMINRTDYCIGPTASHRLPSARRFVGKINSDDTSSRTSSITSTKAISKPKTSLPPPAPPTSTAMVKSHTLPLQPSTSNGHSKENILNSPTKSQFSNIPVRSASTVGNNGKHRSPIADTNALVKQIQNSLSRTSLHDSQLTAPLSISTKDLRTFVSSTYSPSDENMIDDNGVIHVRPPPASSQYDEQAFKRQARLSKSFHNVSEYNSIDQYPKNENNLTSKAQPSKSVENNLDRVSQNPARRHTQIPINFPPLLSSTSFGVLPQSEDNARLLSMKWYTGQVSENSEICYNTPNMDQNDLLYHYVNRHSNREIQSLLARLQASQDVRIHAALDNIRLRVAEFDASKSADDIHTFMRYLESRLRDISNKNIVSSTRPEDQKRFANGGPSNGYHTQYQQSDTMSVKSRTSSVANINSKETPTLPRQLGRQYLRSSGNLVGGESNGYHHHQPPPPPPPPRRSSQSSVNQENPAVFDDMLNTVLGLPKKGVATQPSTYSSSLPSREQTTPLNQTAINHKNGRDVGKRLFESGTLKDPRLIYDGPRTNEKEEQPLETSV